MIYPFILQPAWKDYLWGGERLKTDYHKQTELSPLAESWELSCHPDGESVVKNGCFAGMPLSAVLKQHPEFAGERVNACEFPLMIKLIDAKRDLSIQVHPDDDYARRTENSMGKNEIWYIMDCEEEAEILYGFRRDVSREEFRRAIEQESLTELVNRIPVHKGDVFFIPATTLHAIGKGILIAEIQQSSNLTYRVYDYGRRDKNGNTRPLHIEKAMEVTCLSASACTGNPQETPVQKAGYVSTLLHRCEYFRIFQWDVEKSAAISVDNDRFLHILCLEGEGTLQSCGQCFPIRKGDGFFLPAGSGTARLKGGLSVLLTTV